MAAQAANELDSTYLFHQLDGYAWDEDQEFQGGLRAILGSVQDPAQVEHLTLRAKCYYYARKAGTHVDFDGYKRWVETGGVESGSTTMNGGHSPNGVSEHVDSGYTASASEALSGGDGGMANAPKPASFAEICEMIAEGKPIPGIKDIPDTILEGQASQSSAGRRKKPWEKDGTETDEVQAGAETQRPSWMRA